MEDVLSMATDHRGAAMPVKSAAAAVPARSLARATRRVPLEESVALSVDRTSGWLVERQHADGHWCGELEGDTILESEYVLLLAWLGKEEEPVARQAAAYIQRQQQPGGGWSQYPGGPIEISGSVKAYFALKLTGHDPDADHMRRARQAILAAGGVDAVNSFTRFYLALLGQISYEHCPAVPPEMILLPGWSPISIYRISAWSRTIFVPLSIMWAHRPCRELPAERGIAELFVRPPEKWPPLRCPGKGQPSGIFSWESFFRTADSLLKRAERWRLRPLRRRALRLAEAWMVKRFEHSDGLGAIFPPIIWSVVALKCLGHEESGPLVRECLRQLEYLIITEKQEGQPTVRLQPCKSPVWDTAIALRALSAAGRRGDAAPRRRAMDWLLAKEVTRPGDWSSSVQAEPAGWFFEYNNAFYPDVDDTIMVMMALAESTRGAKAEEAVSAACERARKWILAMQNRDGGWGAFDRNNDAEFLCRVPFADHNAMIDPSTPDIAARVIEALSRFGMTLADQPVARAVAYIRDSQERDGSWFGRWGVNYIYGTWQVLVGLAAAGLPPDDPAIERGAAWLIDHQQPGGGWGESADSYADPARAGAGEPTASQTAWAVLGLIAAGKAAHPATRAGIQYLLHAQAADGSWLETEFTGTGFPLVFYLRYHLYPIYFPLLALATWRNVVTGAAGVRDGTNAATARDEGD